MQIQDRQYQHDTENALREGFKTHTRQIMCLPTGGGKTVVFSNIIAKAVNKNKRVLVLSHRIEIFRQTIKAILHHDIQVCKIDPDNRFINSNALLFVAMVETFKRRMDKLGHLKFDLIICDEAHLRSFDKVLDAYPTTHTIGATATPVPTKKYTNLVHLIDVPELIERGYLMPYRAFQMVDDLSDIEIKRNGDFEETSHFRHYNKKKLYDGVIEKYREKCEGRQTIVYNVSIEHSELMTKAFNDVGIKSYSITSKTSDQERDWIMMEFKRASFAVLNNCGCLTAGTDLPIASAIILNRAISVLTLFIQIVGRGSRPCAEIGKKDFICLDFGLNHDRHGLWNQARAWSLDPPKKRKTTLGMAAVKSCKSCGAVVYASVRKCEFCGYVWEKTEAELRAGQLVEVQNETRRSIPGRYLSELNVIEIVELEKAGNIKPAYAWRIMRARGEAAIVEYARLKGYRDMWVVRQIEAMEAELEAGGAIPFKDKKIENVKLIDVFP